MILNIQSSSFLPIKKWSIRMSILTSLKKKLESRGYFFPHKPRQNALRISEHESGQIPALNQTIGNVPDVNDFETEPDLELISQLKGLIANAKTIEELEPVWAHYGLDSIPGSLAIDRANELCGQHAVSRETRLYDIRHDYEGPLFV